MKECPKCSFLNPDRAEQCIKCRFDLTRVYGKVEAAGDARLGAKAREEARGEAEREDLSSPPSWAGGERFGGQDINAEYEGRTYREVGGYMPDGLPGAVYGPPPSDAYAVMTGKYDTAERSKKGKKKGKGRQARGKLKVDFNFMEPPEVIGARRPRKAGRPEPPGDKSVPADKKTPAAWPVGTESSPPPQPVPPSPTPWEPGTGSGLPIPQGREAAPGGPSAAQPVQPPFKSISKGMTVGSGEPPAPARPAANREKAPAVVPEQKRSQVERALEQVPAPEQAEAILERLRRHIKDAKTSEREPGAALDLAQAPAGVEQTEAEPPVYQGDLTAAEGEAPARPAVERPTAGSQEAVAGGKSAESVAPVVEAPETAPEELPLAPPAGVEGRRVAEPPEASGTKGRPLAPAGPAGPEAPAAAEVIPSIPARVHEPVETAGEPGRDEPVEAVSPEVSVTREETAAGGEAEDVSEVVEASEEHVAEEPGVPPAAAPAEGALAAEPDAVTETPAAPEPEVIPEQAAVTEPPTAPEPEATPGEAAVSKKPVAQHGPEIVTEAPAAAETEAVTGAPAAPGPSSAAQEPAGPEPRAAATARQPEAPKWESAPPFETRRYPTSPSPRPGQGKRRRRKLFSGPREDQGALPQDVPQVIPGTGEPIEERWEGPGRLP